MKISRECKLYCVLFFHGNKYEGENVLNSSLSQRGLYRKFFITISSMRYQIFIGFCAALLFEYVLLPSQGQFLFGRPVRKCAIPFMR